MDLIAHRPNVWSTSVDDVRRVGIPSQVKVLVFLRLIGTDRSLQDLVEQAEMVKQTIRYYLQHFVTRIETVYFSLFLNRWSTRVELGAISQIYKERGLTVTLVP